MDDDLASNRFNSPAPLSPPALTPHPDLCLPDGNIAILTAQTYFIVHQGLLSRHSPVLQQLANSLDPHAQRIESRPVLALEDTPQDMAFFLSALYDGVLLNLDIANFAALSALLRLTTKYQVKLRSSLLRELQRTHWPIELHQWDTREEQAAENPHPILVINLARACDAPRLLPSSFYDLSRHSLSEIALGHVDPQTGVVHKLAPQDLMHLLKGREHASRFLSTFIVNELEGREPSANCLSKRLEDPGQRRTCQAAFESVTFEILRDVNGVTHRSSDPLLAMLDAEVMQTRDNQLRACEYCRAEFGAVVDNARQEFWSKLPVWFGLQ
uniref:BTB domain-containing protein n=1 Tax=Mycena chlorophos TaxID=658473 RepID=A0ABQ0M2U2_MYCCL|nr:predicted protein [Mycena chlorophos]